MKRFRYPRPSRRVSMLALVAGLAAVAVLTVAASTAMWHPSSAPPTGHRVGGSPGSAALRSGLELEVHIGRVSITFPWLRSIPLLPYTRIVVRLGVPLGVPPPPVDPPEQRS